MIEKRAFLPALPLAYMAAPLAAVGGTVTGALTSKARHALEDKVTTLITKKEPPGLLMARNVGTPLGLGVGALAGTMLGAHIGDTYGDPFSGALLGALGGGAAGLASGRKMGEGLYGVNKYFATKLPMFAPYATGALAGGLFGGSVGAAFDDDAPARGALAGLLLGGGLGAIANSAITHKGKFANLLNIASKVMTKKSSVETLPLALSLGLGSAGIAGGFGYDNFDFTTKDVILRRMLPALLAGGAFGTLIGAIANRKDKDAV